MEEVGMQFSSRLLAVFALSLCFLAACGTYFVVPLAKGYGLAVPATPWIDRCVARGKSVLPNAMVRLEEQPELDLSQGTGKEKLTLTLIPKSGAPLSSEERTTIEAFNEILGIGRVGGKLTLERPGWGTRTLAESDAAIHRIRSRVPAFTVWKASQDGFGLESNSFAVLPHLKKRPHPNSYRAIPLLEPYPEPMFMAELKSAGTGSIHTLATLRNADLGLVSDNERSAAKSIGLEGRVRFVPLWVEFIDLSTMVPIGCLPIL
jgi:hypothetical protein